MSKDIALIMLFTFLTIVLWIVFEMYHAGSNVYIVPEVRELSQKLDPSFKTETLDLLRRMEP